MRILLIFFFLLFSTNSNAQKIYKIYGDPPNKKTTEYCTGFCTNETQNVHIAESVQKKKRVVNGKKKNTPTWIEFRGTNAGDTACTTFISWNERIVPLKMKRSEKDKYIKDFKEGKTMLHSHYEINTCRPCPPKTADKRNKSGFCPLPAFTLDVFFKQAIDYGFGEPLFPLNVVEIGRENTGDVNINLKDSLKNIYMELLVIPETKKTDVLFLRVIEKGGLRSWLYSRQNFKTASKQQLIKETQSQYVDDERLADYLDELIFKMQNNFSKVFDLKGKNFNNIDLLYDIIPKDDEIDLFSLSFEKIKNFHIQTRN